MANVKEVIIEGRVPFNCYEEGDLIKLLGVCSLPSFGLSLDWGGCTYLDMGGGRRLAVYDLRISGREAVSYEWLRKFVVELVAQVGGEVSEARVRDVENDGDWEVIPSYTVVEKLVRYEAFFPALRRTWQQIAPDVNIEECEIPLLDLAAEVTCDANRCDAALTEDGLLQDWGMLSWEQKQSIAREALRDYV